MQKVKRKTQKQKTILVCLLLLTRAICGHSQILLFGRIIWGMLKSVVLELVLSDLFLEMAWMTMSMALGEIEEH